MLILFKQATHANIPFSRPILWEKAVEIAKKIKIEFFPSNGSIDRMKKLAGLSCNFVKSKNKCVDPQEIEEWKKFLQDLIASYHLEAVFNMDECGLFFNLLPDKTYTYKGKSCYGSKRNKRQLTVLLCANMDGLEKLPILVIGKLRKSRYFWNLKSLRCDYESNKSVWMLNAIYGTYF